MRDRRRTPAGVFQAEKQQRYLQLVAPGVSNADACRQAAGLGASMALLKPAIMPP